MPISRRFRQYIGLTLVVVAYIGGILGWSWAVLSVDEADAPSPDAETVVPERPRNEGHPRGTG